MMVMPGAVVNVPAYRRDRGELLQFDNNVRLPDVAGVQDMLHTRQKVTEFGIKEIVCVGDNANDHAASRGSGAGVSSSSGASWGSGTGSFSRGDSEEAVSFIAPTNRPVNNPPLKSVLRKNSQVCGQPEVPLIIAVSHHIKSRVYSGFSNTLKNHEAVFVMK